MKNSAEFVEGFLVYTTVEKGYSMKTVQVVGRRFPTLHYEVSFFFSSSSDRRVSAGLMTSTRTAQNELDLQRVIRRALSCAISCCIVWRCGAEEPGSLYCGSWTEGLAQPPANLLML